jgi:hypothetical protein
MREDTVSALQYVLGASPRERLLNAMTAAIASVKAGAEPVRITAEFGDGCNSRYDLSFRSVFLS